MKRKRNMDAKKFLDVEERFLEAFQKLHVLNQQRSALLSSDERLAPFMILPPLTIPKDFVQILEEEVIPKDTKMKEKEPPKPKKPKALIDAEKKAKEGAATPLKLPDTPKDPNFRGEFH